MTVGSISSTAGISTDGGRAKTRARGRSWTGNSPRRRRGRTSSIAVPVQGANFRISSWKWKPWRGRSAIPASTSTRAYQESNSRKRASRSRSTTPPPARAPIASARRPARCTACATSTSSSLPDNEWFKINVARARQEHSDPAQRRCCVVDYTEPTPPMIPQGHGERALSRPRHVRAAVPQRRIVGALPQRARASAGRRSRRRPGAAPVVDATFRKIIDARPRTTSRWWIITCHLKGGLTLEQALAKSRRDGIGYGIARELREGLSRRERRRRSRVRRQHARPAGLRRHAGRRARVDADVLARARPASSTTSSPTR